MSFANYNDAITALSTVGTSQTEIIAFVKCHGSSKVLVKGWVANEAAWKEAA